MIDFPLRTTVERHTGTWTLTTRLELIETVTHTKTPDKFLIDARRVYVSRLYGHADQGTRQHYRQQVTADEDPIAASVEHWRLVEALRNGELDHTIPRPNPDPRERQREEAC